MNEPTHANAKTVTSFDTPLMDRINLYFRLRRYIKMLARRWFIVVFAVVVGVGIAAQKAFNLPEIYRAASKIGIATRIINPYENKAFVAVELNSFYETHLQYMQSTKVRTRVEEKMRTDNRFAGMGPPMSNSAPFGGGKKK